MSTLQLKSIKCDPTPGKLLSLKTTLEIRPGDALIEVYVTKVPPKAASGILRSVVPYVYPIIPGLASQTNNILLAPYAVSMSTLLQ